MKKISVTTILLLCTVAAFGQFFPTKEGTALRYASYSNGKKADAYITYTVGKVTGSKDDMSVAFRISMDDGKGTTVLEGIDAKVDIIDGETYMDCTSLFPATSLSGGMITFTGDGSVYPAKLSVGQTLADATATMTVNLGIAKIRTTVTTTNQTVDSKETLETEAGSIECYKLSATQTMTMGKKSATASYTQWIADGIGLVKQETYDDKGKLTGKTELVSIE